MRRALSAVGILLAAFAVVWATARPSPASAQAKAPGAGGSITTPVTGSSGAFGAGGISTDGGVYVGPFGVIADGGFWSTGGGVSLQGSPPLVSIATAGFSAGNVSSFLAICLPQTSSYSLANCQFYSNGTTTFVNAPSGSGLAFRSNNVDKAAVDATYGLTNAVAIGTAGSGTGIATVVTAAERHYTHVITVARTNLTNAATTQDVTLWTVPARTRVRAVIADATAAFDDAAGPISAVTITCGKTAGGAEYLLSGSVFTVNTLGDATGEVGASLTSYFGDIPSWSATTAIQCRFTSTGGNLSTLTTGSATFYLEMESLP